MIILTNLGLIWLAAALFMMALWLLQRRTGNAGIVDVGWSFSLGVAALALGLGSDGVPARRGLVMLMGGLWGLRLAWHIHRRSHGRTEDGRYRRLRELYGTRVQQGLFRFFQLQAASVPLFSLPFALAGASATPFGRWSDVAALLLWLIGQAGESLADGQLNAFKAEPGSAGRVCRNGLWRYSRHPNYFFTWVTWCGFSVLALAHPFGVWSLLCPAALLYLLLRVTGIPPTEEQALRSKGEAYRDYQRTTHRFFPWFPKENRS